MKVKVKVPFKAEIGLRRSWDGYRSTVSESFCCWADFTEEVDTEELGDALIYNKRVILSDVPELKARFEKKALEIARKRCAEHGHTPHKCKYEHVDIEPILNVEA